MARLPKTFTVAPPRPPAMTPILGRSRPLPFLTRTRGIDDRYAKTIIFCEDIDHAERMRQALVNEDADLAAGNPRYVVRITGDSPDGKLELDNFIDPESRYPVIATTSELMTTGVDVPHLLPVSSVRSPLLVRQTIMAAELRT